MKREGGEAERGGREGGKEEEEWRQQMAENRVNTGQRLSEQGAGQWRSREAEGMQVIHQSEHRQEVG